MTHLQLSLRSDTQDQCWRCPEGPVQRQNGGIFVPATTWVRISQPLGSCSNLHAKLHAQNLYSLQPLMQSPPVKRRSAITKFCTLSTLDALRTVWACHNAAHSPLMYGHL
ncbi:hypothetical protein NPIL_373221 [Nephila pilipes]|uniref:Uncharacterized protein n=1 Tax=Nephila pilipes TaxID=299642 RepID=A0A8X6TCT1_NEPPI|nr:hypothetical protein NPIL_373221 [Nephila pilipes]